MSTLYKKPIIETIVSELKSASTEQIDYLSILTNILDGVVTSISKYDLSGFVANKMPATISSKLVKADIHFNNPTPKRGFLFNRSNNSYWFVELKQPKCTVYKLENNEIKEQYNECLTILEIRENIREGAGGGGTGAVSSVNGKTGEVVLTTADIKTTTTQTTIQANLERLDERIDDEGLNLENLQDILIGDTGISVDEGEAGTEQEDKLVVRIDGNYKQSLDTAINTAAKALVTPTTAPTGNTLVGIGTGREQTQIYLGTGLTLTGDTSPYTLSASGASGDTKLYRHILGSINLYEHFGTQEVKGSISNFSMILANDTPITKNDIMNYLMSSANVNEVILTKGTVGLQSGTYFFAFQSPGLLLKSDNTIVSFSSLNVNAAKDDIRDTVTEL